MQFSCIKFVFVGIIRKTKSLARVLDTFQKSDAAISVVQLTDNMKHHMNKTTVYRILDRLKQEGIVHSFHGKDGLKWYAKCSDHSSHQNTDTHPHFHCNHCGAVECLPIDIQIPDIPNLQISSAEVILAGICSKCNP